jgi:hypothetical protein
MQFSAAGGKLSAGLREESETIERERASERETRESVKEEKLGGEGNYGACVETTWRLALLPQACR